MAQILTLTLNPALDLTVKLGQLRAGEVNRSDAMFTHAAGKGLNVAQVLADLGHQLTVSGFLGLDNPQAFDQLFEQRGFVDAFVRVPGETRSNIKLAEADGQITDINGPGLQVSSEAQQALFERIERIAGQFDAVVVAGSLPRGVSPQWLQRLLGMLNKQGIKVALDTSGEALRACLQAAPWLIKPNTDELAEVLGVPLEPAAALVTAARELQRHGIEHVVVSQSAEGLCWFRTGAALHALPPKVSVASTVGAGDSLLAGLLHGLLSGHEPQQALRTATAIAAMAVTQIGFGISDAAQLEQLASGVTVCSLNEE